MRKPIMAPGLFLLVALLALLLTPNLAHAARSWKFGNAIYYTAGAVCRDGAELIAGDTAPVPLGIRHYTSGATVDYETIIEDYGPMLVPSRIYTMTYHVDPIEADINNNGTIDKTFYVYMDETVFWGPLLDVGQKVIVYEIQGIDVLEAEVEDCLLRDELSVYLKASETLEPADFAIDPFIMLPEHLVYRVTTLPAQGVLRLNGVPLGVGGRFTPADVAAGRLAYTHTGDGVLADSFGYSVRGIMRISTGLGRAQANGGSFNAAINSDGRHIIFESDASNLVANDTGNVRDVFLFNRRAATTNRLSVSAGGVQGNNNSTNAALSALGSTPSYAFESLANNLVASDTNGVADIFGFSGTGNLRRVSIRGSTVAPAQANGASSNPAVSADGDYLAFQSVATDIAANIPSLGGLDTNGVSDVFYYDYRFTPSTLVYRASLNSAEVEGNGSSTAPSISTNGQYIAYASIANNLVASDTNNLRDIFVRDRFAGTTARVSITTAGGQATSTVCFFIIGCSGSFAPDITPDGRFVAYYSYANNLVGAGNDTNELADIYLRDRTLNTTSRISLGVGGAEPDGNSINPAISADGRFIVFQSTASNLVAGDTNGVSDIFLHDRQSGTTTRLSTAADGSQANGASFNPAISYDGSFVTFESTADNLVAGDTNNVSDIFLVYTGYTSSTPVKIIPTYRRFAPALSR
ncbi:MAG TPA: cadherin-like domain-containing protein [Roseiflexaceae bacterium]|nr:cadherin-like domain-containing protein [Roseiflexaceae bacterium]